MSEETSLQLLNKHKKHADTD